MTGAIDIDGVLAASGEDPGSYATCEAVRGAVEGVRSLKLRGHEIVLHTGRHWIQRHTTREWLVRNGIWQFVDHIVFGKPVADYYLDDRALRFTDWGTALREIG